MSDERKIAGHVRLSIRGIVKSDCFTDYAERWRHEESIRFDAADSGHFGWVIGRQVGYLGEALIRSRTSNEDEAYEMFASALEEMACDIRDRIPRSPDSLQPAAATGDGKTHH